MAILAGIHAVKHALDSNEALDELLILKGKTHPRLNELAHLAKQQRIRVTFLPREALERLAEGVPHQGVVARLQPKGLVDFKSWLITASEKESGLVLLLDQVTDPHNLGACIRTAEAAGCLALIVPKDHAANLDSPVVAKSASGALSRLPIIRVTNLVRSMEDLKQAGFWVSGLAGEAENALHQTKFSGKNALVMGAEGTGMRRLVRKSCDQLIRIPMPGHIESLNVSVATGIALFEVVRQSAI